MCVWECDRNDLNGSRAGLVRQNSPQRSSRLAHLVRLIGAPRFRARWQSHSWRTGLTQCRGPLPSRDTEVRMLDERSLCEQPCSLGSIPRRWHSTLDCAPLAALDFLFERQMYALLSDKLLRTNVRHGRKRPCACSILVLHPCRSQFFAKLPWPLLHDRAWQSHLILASQQ